MGKALVICIGNLARGDDGVAHRVGDLLGDLDARIVRAAQLDVVMAEDVSRAGALIIVDAQRRESPPVTVTRVAPTPLGVGSTSHGLDVGGLLTLSRTLYASAPDLVHLVTVAAPEMGHDDTLSETAEAASVEAASVVRRLASESP